MIIGLTGRIGAGKETLTGFLRDRGFIYLKSSELLKEELAKRGVEISRWNMQNLGDELREKYGSGAIMKMFLDKIISNDKGKNYILDSLRNAKEADFLRENLKDFFLIGVDAPQKLRFERIVSRGKPSDPKTWEEFLEVDNRDFFDEKNPLGQQVGKVMGVADFIIINDNDLRGSMEEIENIWEEIKKRTVNSFKGVIIKESLDDENILKNKAIKIISTKVEKVTDKHKTPWLKQWTLHTVNIDKNKASEVADRISKSLDKEHDWYADYKNNEWHFIIFRDKVFKINRKSKEEYDQAKEYGISFGIPEYQVNFHPETEEWKR
jgi:dephospho-CoA kinase